VKLCPFAYEPQRPSRQRTVDNPPRSEFDLRLILPYLAWKCGGGWSGRYIQITIRRRSEARHWPILRNGPVGTY